MRSMLFSTALIFAAMTTTGCVSFSVKKGCDTSGAIECSECSECSDCGSGKRIGGILGRLRGEQACSDCGDVSCSDGSCGGAAMPGSGIGGGIGSRLGAGLMAGGFGKCKSCGLMGGRCGCAGIGNAAPYTPHPYAGGGQGEPQMGTYAYPYYTTRAPRDFLMANPPSIGR